MHPRQIVPPTVVRLARLQAGAITREQAVGCGLGSRAVDRLVRDGHWLRIAAGVYLAHPGAAAGNPGWPALVWAGCLLGGDDARAGEDSAGHLWGLVDQPDGDIVIFVPDRLDAPRVTGPWRFRREHSGLRDSRSTGSPPRTSLEDTVLDLVAADGAALRWTTAALQTRRTTVRRLEGALTRRRRIPHRKALLEVLADLGAGAESALEVRYLRDVERAHGLPPARRQVRRRQTVADVLYEEFGLLVELDGRRGHHGEGRFRDMRRDNAATTDGLATLRYGWPDVHERPCAVAAQVAENLVLRGWSGFPVPCDRCRRAA